MNDLLKGLPQEQRAIMKAYATIQTETMSIDMLSGQYAEASIQQNKKKKQECANLMLERAKVLLDAAEKLASMG